MTYKPKQLLILHAFIQPVRIVSIIKDFGYRVIDSDADGECAFIDIQDKHIDHEATAKLQEGL